jgi:hypothetical protein
MRIRDMQCELEKANHKVTRLTQLIARTSEEQKQTKERLLEEYSKCEPEHFVSINYNADRQYDYDDYAIGSVYELRNPLTIQVLVDPCVGRRHLVPKLIKMALSLLEEEHCAGAYEKACQGKNKSQGTDEDDLPF